MCQPVQLKPSLGDNVNHIKVHWKTDHSSPSINYSKVTFQAVPQIRIDVIGYLTPLFLINRVESKLKGFSDCFHSHNLK